MTVSPEDLMKAKVQGIRSTLQRTPPAQKKNHVSLAVAQDFNAVLKMAGEQFPEISSALPAQLQMTGPFSQIGVAAVSFLDLEVLTEQVLNLLDLVEKK